MLYSGALTATLAACAAATGSGVRARGIITNDGVRCACNQLATADPDALLRPSSTQYSAQCINVWDKRSNLAPACIYLPTTAESAANAIGIFNTCGAQFAVRGGGHMNVSKCSVLELYTALTKMVPGPRLQLHQRRRAPRTQQPEGH